VPFVVVDVGVGSEGFALAVVGGVGVASCSGIVW
jgi:hypothetical protein